MDNLQLIVIQHLHRHPPNGKPIANAGPNQVVSQGSLVTLSGAGSSAQNGATIVSYSWVQTSAAAVTLNGASTAAPTFTAPTVSTTLTFSLTVKDSNGAVSSPATVTITVGGNNNNQPPISNAGTDQTVSPGVFVTLNGAGSFAQNGATIVSYSWVQTSGIPVSLNGANTVTPTFVAPVVASILSFSLTVTDSNDLTSSPALVTVTVR
jgi:hypothetical protein